MAGENLIQWFPGHMTKTNRMIKANLPNIDMVMEIIDARVAGSSKNTQLGEITNGKPRLLVINKVDLADDAVTKEWVSWYRSQGICVATADGRSNSGVSGIVPAIMNLMNDKIEKLKAKGMGGKAIRVMVVGIPNVGKSSLINRLARGRRVKVEDRPGVTRGKQWVSITDTIELLDTPGVLWPKFESQEDAQKLAFTGAIKDDIIDVEWLACMLLDVLGSEYPAVLQERYGVCVEQDDSYDLLEKIGKKRGMLMSGGIVNTERAATMILDEFRGGKLGRISLERPVKA